MSAIVDHSPSLPASRAILVRSVGRAAVSTITAIRVWRRRMRQRRELLMLNVVELRDVSLSEADIDCEARKPFWQVIRLGGR